MHLLLQTLNQPTNGPQMACWH